MTVRQVLDYDQIVKVVIDNMKDVDAKIRFRFLQMAHQFQPIVDGYNKIREEKIAKYGSMQEDGQFGIFEPQKETYENDEDYQKAVENYNNTINQFRTELNEVLEEKAKIELDKFHAEEIMNSGLPSDMLLVLYDLIEE